MVSLKPKLRSSDTKTSDEEVPDYLKDEEEHVDEALKEELKEIEELDKEKQGSTYYPMCYRLLTNKAQFLYPRMISLEKKLKKSGIPIPYEPYICGMVFASILVGIICVGIGLVFALLIKFEPALIGYLMPVFFGFGGSQATFGIMYMLPSMSAKSRASKLQEPWDANSVITYQ